MASRYRSQINNLANALRAGGSLTAIGHTDTVGAAADNRDLALARANAVRTALVSAGAPPSSIQIASVGESDCRSVSEDESCRKVTFNLG